MLELAPAAAEPARELTAAQKNEAELLLLELRGALRRVLTELRKERKCGPGSRSSPFTAHWKKFRLKARLDLSTPEWLWLEDTSGSGRQFTG